MRQGYVVTYNNGSGYYEWASPLQPTPKAAWEAAGIKEGEEFFPGSNPQLEFLIEPSRRSNGIFASSGMLHKK